jgi:hypothetical protein
MRTAQIDGGNAVANVIDAPEGYTLPGFTLVASATANTGDAYDPQRGTFTPRLGPAKALKLAHAAGYFLGLFALPNGFTYSGALYQIDYPDSQSAITAMGSDAAASLAGHGTWDAGFYFIAADNSHVAMDAATMLAFAQAVADYVRKSRYRFRVLKDQILAAADFAALNAIDETSGYPTSSA